jgi:transposase-like protein
MDLASFHQQFPDEQSCINHFKEKRLTSGMCCSRCEGKNFSYLNGKKRFYCKDCNKSISLKSGTVMENSNLPFKSWLFCMKYMTMTKKGISAKEMQRLLGFKRYEPVWYMMHKLRAVMGKRDDLYTLSQSVEIDEGFFESTKDSIKNAEKEDTDQDKNEKRGRGSSKQSKVLVMVESKEVKQASEKYKHKTNKKVGFLKMKLMSNLTIESINNQVKSNIEKQTEVLSDGYRGYNKLKKVIKTHLVLVEPDKSKSAKLFPWVNRTISNAKKVLLGNHHNVINQKYIQNYLNEFCYKFNRRYFEDKITDRLIIACLNNTWD